MKRSYDDARFGVRKYLVFKQSGALNGTVGATTIGRIRVMEASTVYDWNIECGVGGTEAGVRQLTLNTSLAGTGAVTAIGTQALGTQANNTVVNAACTQTDVADGDDLVLQHFGTGAGVWDVRAAVLLRERYVDA